MGSELAERPVPVRNLEVRSLFATPVAIAFLSDAEQLNEALKRIILDREKRHPGAEHSNRGGWQSTWDFAKWGGPPLQAVLRAGSGLAARLTVNREGKPVRLKWEVNCWANINRKGHSNEFHTHPGAFWSGTYYVDDGGAADDPRLGGEFEIQDPRGAAPVMYAPMLGIAMPGGASLGASEVLRPRAGMLVMFPSWLQHAVRPYLGDGARISVAFNLSL